MVIFNSYVKLPEGIHDLGVHIGGIFLMVAGWDNAVRNMLVWVKI